MDGPKMEQGPTLAEQLKHWKTTKEILEDWLKPYESGAVNDIGSDAAEIPKMQVYEDRLTEIASLCERIRNAPDKIAEIKNLVEILLQKDPKWLEEEADNDLRISFFMQYFYQGNPGYENRLTEGIPRLSPAEIIEELRNKRFDPTFYADIESKLDSIESSFATFSEDNRKTMKWLKRDSDRSERTGTKNVAKLRLQLAEADSNIARIEVLLARSFNKDAPSPSR